MHEPLDPSNPEDGPVVKVKPGDTVKFKGRTGNWSVTFVGDAPFSRASFGGHKDDEDGDVVLHTAQPIAFKYFAVVTGGPGGAASADPDIVVT